MTLSYNVGLTGGALAAYLLEKLLGPTRLKSCNLIPGRSDRIPELRNFTSRPITQIATALSTTTISKEIIIQTTMSSFLSTFINATTSTSSTMTNILNNDIP